MTEKDAQIQIEKEVKFTDSLRGYSFAIHKRDGFKCRYCGLDGTDTFGKWLSLSLDHLLPKGHADRNKPEFTVTACMFCNTADNRYFDQALKREITFDGKTPEQLVDQRKEYVQKTRDSYEHFWNQHVRPAQQTEVF